MGKTIKSIAERALKHDWFNKEHSLNITKSDLIGLLRFATGHLRGKLLDVLHQETAGNRKQDGRRPLIRVMSDVETAPALLATLNNTRPSIDFTSGAPRKRQACLSGNGNN